MQDDRQARGKQAAADASLRPPRRIAVRGSRLSSPPRLTANHFRAWLLKPQWTAEEAALIFCYLDPDAFKPGEAYATQTMRLLDGVRSLLAASMDGPFVSAAKSPEEWHTLAAESGLLAASEYMEGVQAFRGVAPEDMPQREVGWPWGTYETKLLRDLSAAVDRYWRNFDPSDPTQANTKETVVEWLVKSRGVSERIAQAMDTIIRAEGLPKGPRSGKGSVP